MSLTAEDAQLQLTVDPDVAEMFKAIESIGKQLSSVSKQMSDKLGSDMTTGLSRGIKAGIDQGLKDSQPVLDSWMQKLSDHQKNQPDAMIQALNTHQAIEKWKEGLPTAGLPTITPKQTLLQRLLGHFQEGGGLNPQQLLGSVLGGAAGGGIGGGIGAGAGGLAAMGGPVGIAIAGVAAAGKAVSMAVDGVATSFRELQGPLGPIGIAFNALDVVLPGVGSGLKDIVTSLTAFASLNSPGEFRMWTMALEDTQAVIGKTFVPVLNLMRDGVREFGDILATILPDTQEMNEALAEVKIAWLDLKSALTETMSDLGPILKSGLIAGIQILTSQIRAITLPIVLLSKAFTAMYAPVASLLSLFGVGGGGLRTSVGAAARHATIGSLESYQTALQTSAFSIPNNGPQERTANATENILNLMRNRQAANRSTGTLEAATPLGRLINSLTGGMAGYFAFGQ
jgi:hypothetical protein